MYTQVIKPFFDTLVSLLLLVVISPVIIGTIAILIVVNRGKVFFLQPRPGKNGRIFKIYKFKTMNDRKDEQGELLPDAIRLTPTGRLLRKLSVDELLQLINVIKGEMSLIGPRPLLVEYLPLYNTEQMRRHDVKPGISGWAQVNGRNAISWKQKFIYDVYYVEHISFLLDLKIAFMTIAKLFTAKGITDDKGVSAEKFKGNNTHETS